MAKTFVLSDESINSFGFWVKTSGIDLRQFKKNPIMLWNHNRPSEWRGSVDEILPIGKWENIRIDGDKLLADAVFDQNDEFAKKIESKVENGILNMCSMGIRKVTESDAQEFLKPGQTYATVTKCKLREVSICDIGSNDNALVLYDDDGQLITMSASGTAPLKPLIINNMDIKTIALKLGLNENSDESVILSAIQALNDKAEKVIILSDNACLKLGIDAKNITANAIEEAIKTLSERAEKAEKTLSDQTEAKCTALVDTAVKDGRITAELKETYIDAARKNYEAAEKAIMAIPEKTTLSDIQKEGGYVEGSIWAKRVEEIRKGGANG